MSKYKDSIIAIVGPTGSGKTALAKFLALKFNGSLISVDSRQVYRGMDVGTAKEKNFPQELIDIRDPAENFSVAEFQELAKEAIAKKVSEKKVPILVGGTGLYLEALLYDYKIPDLKEESLKLRAELEKLSDAVLAQKLKELDFESAETIHPANRRRIIRALEYTLLNEQPFSQKQKKNQSAYRALLIGIDFPRETLYAKIDARVDSMLKDGLVEEVRRLIAKYPADLPALNTIGYKEIIDYLQNRCNLQEAIQKIKNNSHSYVRRQMTWFRRDKSIKWIQKPEEAEKLIKLFLKAK
jgi:tRNA dimethylallyltransferase